MPGKSGGDVKVRFSVENADAVQRALTSLGQDGDRALNSLVQSSKLATNAITTSWRALETLDIGGRQRKAFEVASSIERFFGVNSATNRMKELGLQDAVITGMLKRVGRDFVVVQNEGDKAAASIGKVAVGIDVLATSGEKASRGSSGFIKFLTALGGAGVVVGALALIRKSVDEVIETADRADDTRLGTDLLLALKAGATEARVPMDDLNSAIDRFTAVSKKAEDDAEEFYKALGNVDKALVTAFKSAETQGERWRIVADGIARAKNEVQRYQLAQQAFGTDSDRFIEFLARGSQGIDALIQRNQALGISLDKDVADRLRQSQARFDTLITLIQQRGTVALANFADEIGKVVEQLGETYLVSVLKTATGGVDTLDKALRSVTFTLQELYRIIDQHGREGGPGFGEMTSGVAGALGIGGTVFGQTFGTLSNPNTALRQQFFVQGQSAGTAWADGFYDAVGIAGSTKLTVNKPPDTSGRAFAGRPSLTGGTGSSTESKDAFDRQIDSINKQVIALNANAAALSLTEGAAASLRAELQLLQALERAGEGVTTEQIDAYVKLRAEMSAKQALDAVGIKLEEDKAAQFEKTTSRIGQATSAYQNLRQQQELLTDFASGFVRDLRNGVDWVEALTNAFNKLADKLIDMAIKDLVGQALSPGSGASGGLLSLLSGLFGGAGGVGTLTGTASAGAGVSLSAKGNIFSGRITPFGRGGVFNHPFIFPMANGGIGMGAEAGPEAIMPLRRTAGGRLGVEAMGGQAPPPQITIVTPPGASAETSQRQVNGQWMTDIIISTVNEGMVSGQFDGGMQRYGNQPVNLAR